MHHRPRFAAFGLVCACWVAFALAAVCTSGLARAADSATKKTATPAKTEATAEKNKPVPELVLFFIVDASKGTARFKAATSMMPAISKINSALKAKDPDYPPIVGRPSLIPSTNMVDGQVRSKIKQVKWTKKRRKKGVRSVFLTCTAEIEDARRKKADEDAPARFKINLKVDCEVCWIKKDKRQGFKKKKIWKKSFKVEYVTPKDRDPNKAPETEYSALGQAAYQFAEQFFSRKSRKRWMKK